MKYELRPATNVDYRYCYWLTKRNMYELFCHHWGGWVPARFREGYLPEYISIVIINGKRAGYLTVRPDDEGFYIDNIQISPRMQGKGIGTDLIKQLLTDHPKKITRLTTFIDNPAKRLYERLGFRVIETHSGTLKMEHRPHNRYQVHNKTS